MTKKRIVYEDETGSFTGHFTTYEHDVVFQTKDGETVVVQMKRGDGGLIDGLQRRYAVPRADLSDDEDLQIVDAEFVEVVDSEPNEAPKGLLVDLFVPTDRAEDILYNLQARYPHWVEKHGERKARAIFLSQSLGAVVSIWVDWGLAKFKVFKSLRKS